MNNSRTIFNMKFLLVQLLVGVFFAVVSLKSIKNIKKKPKEQK